jgi:VWFA-related protein
MPVLRLHFNARFLAVLLCCCLTAVFARAQQTPPAQDNQTEAQEDDTLRISTELIQTGVTVLDKQGRFVGGLAQEDFELRVDGKPVSISFFERLSAKSGDDTEPGAAGRPGVNQAGANDAAGPEEQRRGRTVIFLVDDLHLSFDSHKRTKDMVARFIEREVEPDDVVVVASTSGKIGFLQQFTSDKMVMRAAVERLKYGRDLTVNDRQFPPMSEYQAMLIERYDQEVTQIFVSALLRENPTLNPEDAQVQVRSRAQNILQQSRIFGKATYAALEQLMRRSAQVPGRKVVFFISDGIFLDPTSPESTGYLQRIADAASRANAVIYSFDAKGLDASLPEAGGGLTAYRVQSGERWESQDVLSSLAQNTGGRFIHNTNDLKGGVTKALEETSVYYLLAWRPEPESRGPEKFRRIEVSVKRRPELAVRVQSGYLDGQPPAKDKGATAKVTAPTPESQLRSAFNAPVPQRALPTSLVANYLDTPREGPSLAVALQIKGAAVEFTQAGEKATAEIDVVGRVFNSQGKPEGFFNDRLTVGRPASSLNEGDPSDIYYNYQAKLKPGLYQVRVAARDVKSGRLGSAEQWIEIPDLAARRLALSSLLLGERAKEPKQQKVVSTTDLAPGGIQISVDRRFASTSHLRYVLYIYNAARGQGAKTSPDVALQTQIFRGSSLVMTSPSRQVSAEGQDPAQLSYAAEIPLNEMAPGRYELRITVIDRVAKTSATQRASFEVN